MLQKEDSLKILIMDDDPDWCTTISEMSRLLGHNAEAVFTLEDAQEKIQVAFNAGEPYLIAVVDLNFETGKDKTMVPRGKETIRFIKTHHPYMACLVVSGADFTHDQVLDMRDEYDLDYYLQKDRFDLDTFSGAIKKSLRRVNAVDTSQSHLKNLEEALGRWKNVRAILLNDLAKAREREALKGIDVDVATKNEIDRYQKHLEEIEKNISLLEKEISEETGKA